MPDHDRPTPGHGTHYTEKQDGHPDDLKQPMTAAADQPRDPWIAMRDLVATAVAAFKDSPPDSIARAALRAVAESGMVIVPTSDLAAVLDHLADQRRLAGRLYMTESENRSLDRLCLATARR